jgi:death on curing protein
VAILFPTKQEVIEIHTKAIEIFGGSHGLRDERALESALAAAKHRVFYDNVDLATCAATYAFHLSKAHAFIDGNKRVAAAITELFLEINGARLNLSNDEIVDLFLSIAAGGLSRDEVEQVFSRAVLQRF